MLKDEGSFMEYQTNVPKTYTPAASAGLFFLRLIPFVLLFIYHGWGKLVAVYLHFAQGQEWQFISAVQKMGFPSPEYFALGAALAEGVFSILILIGLLTRISAAVVTFNFLVAIYSHLMANQKFELPALYLASAIALVFLGAGAFSLDALITRSRMERRVRRLEEKQRMEPAPSRKVPRTGVPETPEYRDKSEPRL